MNSQTSASVRVLIVDDHPFMRAGLAQTIKDRSGMTVCGEAGNIPEALQLMGQHRPDLAVVDLSLGEESGLDLIKAIKDQWPATRILVSSMHDETLFAERVLRAGALGYVNKGETPEVFVAALERVGSGQVYLSERMTSRMLGRMLGDNPQQDGDPIAKLSNRELEVFELIGNGLVTKQIAARLGLSPKTIETYREHIKAKLNLANASELTRHAVQWVLERGRQSPSATSAPAPADQDAASS